MTSPNDKPPPEPLHLSCLISLAGIALAVVACITDNACAVVGAPLLFLAALIALVLVDETTGAQLIEFHLTHLAGHEVGNRPDRVEPRAIKRRPKPQALLTKPRDEARADLMAGKV